MKGLEIMNKNCIKELLNKDYFVYIVFKFLTITTIVLAIYFLLNIESIGNLYFVISLFVVNIFLTITTSRLKTPKLAKCLYKTPIYINIFVGLFIHLGLGLFVISVATGFVHINIVYFSVALFIFGVSIYFYICKRNKIFEKKDSDV